MFSWNEFSTAALAMEGLGTNDAELRSILRQPHPPAEATNEFGQPICGSAVIRQHPDVPNYKRIIQVRKQIAVEKNDQEYVSYADQIQTFLNSVQGPFVLFVVVIATGANLYEFLFLPETRRILAAPFQDRGSSGPTADKQL